MAMDMRQQMKLSQKLVMTPQLQQAIKLLQLSRLELQSVVQQELEENPVLEESGEPEGGLIPLQDLPISAPMDLREMALSTPEERAQWELYLGDEAKYGESYDDDERPSLEGTLTRCATLTDHLLGQLQLGPFSDQEVKIGRHIVGNLNDDGFLECDTAELAKAVNCSLAETEATLNRLQEQLEPAGVAARNLRESLLIQARRHQDMPALAIALLEQCTRELEQRNFKAAAKVLGVDLDQVLLAARALAQLDPRPGSAFGSGDARYITPDVYVEEFEGDFRVFLNDEGIPNLRVNPFYAPERLERNRLDQQTQDYLGEKTRSALWLIKSIQQRQRTIFRVAESIVRFQHDFFRNGITALKPLVLRDVAEDIGMHESTISRVTTSKYMQTPQGLFELKFFFNSGIATSDGAFIASESVKDRIRGIVAAEDPLHPYSDQRLAEILSENEIHIARRTVTKYREMLQLGSSSERRRYF